MSVWSWKKSGWLGYACAFFLLAALGLSIASMGFRKKFHSFPIDINFDGGSYPELGVFNLMLYISSLLGMACSVLRYVYVVDKNMILSKASDIVNKISLLPGLSSFFGLLLIASFSGSSKQSRPVQTVGTYMFYGFGAVFSIIQSFITFTYARCSKITVIRFILAGALAGSFVASLVLIESNKRGIPSTTENITFYEASNTSNIQNNIILARVTYGLECSIVLIYIVFFLSFFFEYQRISTYVILRPYIFSTASTNSSSWTVNERV